MASLSAANTFTSPVLRQGGVGFDVTVSGTFSGTVSVQISKDQTTWMSVDSLTAAGVLSGLLGTAWYIRAGFETGAYTSGTAVVDVY